MSTIIGRIWSSCVSGSNTESPAAVRACGGVVGLVALLAVCAAAFLPGLFTIPAVDRDESRFAQASRQMFESAALPSADRTPELHSGGLIVPRVAGTDRLNKPPLIYWLQAGSAAICTLGHPASDAIWMYRLPSAVAAIATVLIAWRLGASMRSPTTGLIAGVLLAVCPIIAWESRQARADMVMLVCTTAAMGALWVIWSRRGPLEAKHPEASDSDDPAAHHTEDATEPAPESTSTPSAGWLWPITLWLATALGLMTKGVTPLIVLFTILTLALAEGRWRWIARLRPLTGLGIILAVTLPWVIAVAVRVGPETYFSQLFGETAGRSASAREGHWGPPGYHLVLLAALFWPGSLLTLAGLIRLVRVAVRFPPIKGGVFTQLRALPVRWRARVLGRDAELFLLCWIIPGWIFFELVATKLPHYTMPLYPAIALATAMVLLDTARDARTAAANLKPIGIWIWLAIGLAFTVVVPPLLGLTSGSATILLPLGILSAVVSAALLWWGRSHLIDQRPLAGQLLGVAAMLVFIVLTLGVVLPSARTPWITRQLTRTIADLDTDPASPRPIAAVSYHEDSLVFATRGRLERINTDDARSWLARHPRGLLIVPNDRLETIDPDLALTGSAPGLSRLATARGFNYSKGDPADLAIIGRPQPGPPTGPTP